MLQIYRNLTALGSSNCLVCVIFLFVRIFFLSFCFLLTSSPLSWLLCGRANVRHVYFWWKSKMWYFYTPYYDIFHILSRCMSVCLMSGKGGGQSWHNMRVSTHQTRILWCQVSNMFDIKEPGMFNAIRHWASQQYTITVPNNSELDIQRTLRTAVGELDRANGDPSTICISHFLSPRHNFGISLLEAVVDWPWEQMCVNRWDHTCSTVFSSWLLHMTYQ